MDINQQQQQQQQEQSLLRAIAISAALCPSLMITAESRKEAFRTLEEFKNYPDRIRITVGLLQTEQHILQVQNNNNNNNGSSSSSGGGGGSLDVTASTKLYGLSILEQFFQKGYAKVKDEQDRLALRSALMMAAQQLQTNSSNNNNNNNNNDNKCNGSNGSDRILGMKIAALLAELAIREFPQRWPTLVSDLFSPSLWTASNGGSSSSSSSSGVGVKMVLECLKQMTEDCTDSDFNSKMSTSRRNDVLIGLNEIHGQFLPPMFELLSEQYQILMDAKRQLHEMTQYVQQQGRVMTSSEEPLYMAQIRRRDSAGLLLVDGLGTIQTFCQSMPLDWIMPNNNHNNNNNQNNNHNNNQNNNDFCEALLHFLREESCDIQVAAVTCLEQLCLRKLEFNQWYRLITHLPQAVSDANQHNPSGQLVDQLPFHRGLSRMLAKLISTHLAHISNCRDIVQQRNTAPFQAIANYLHLMAEMLAHPSPKVCGEQIVTWIGLLRDPAIAKCSTKLLAPYMERVLHAYTRAIVRLRWDDVDEGTHPQADLMEASWDDYDDFDTWLSDLRSKTTQIFKYIGSLEPKLSATILSHHVQSLLHHHGHGEPRDCLDSFGHLTPTSQAILQLEGAVIPMDSVLRCLPAWALDDSKPNDPSYNTPHRIDIRNHVRTTLSQLATAIVHTWNPSELWLKFRKTTFLDALKHYWLYDPTTLPAGVDCLLAYLVATDNPNNNHNNNNKCSDDVVSLRKKSGTALVSVSKRVPHLLVTWLTQLSERAKELLSSDALLPLNRMHLFEFLSCVVTAVQDPVTRSSFISDVLSNAISMLESDLVQQSIASSDGLLHLMGIADIPTHPNHATDPTNVKRVTSNFQQLFSAFNQLLSVGKRCHEAARKGPNGGIPFLSTTNNNSNNNNNNNSNNNFPDEGPVSISDLAVNDAFVHLWPKILPSLIRTLDVLLTIWHPHYQATLLCHPIQRFALAMSDDEVYLAKKMEDNCGVFGKGGTAGSIVSGWSRRDANLAPKWSGWFNELRNTCFQLLGLLAMQRVLYAPEIASLYPQLVSVLANTEHLRAMENRHMTQYLKQFTEILMLSCPVTLYTSHLSPLLGPLFQHLQYRLDKNWNPIIHNHNHNNNNTRPLTTSTCDAAAVLARTNPEDWYLSYYARTGLFVGDLDAITAEAAVEKNRVELSRSFCDMLQAVLSLKGDWALVLANQAKEEKGDVNAGPRTRITNQVKGPVNADGTPRSQNQSAIDARKHLRINRLCHFLLLEDERIAGFLVLTLIQSLEYPDAYICRRVTKICHRILETAAWVDRYTPLLGDRMFSMTIKSIATEPKWMVGVEWDVINLMRDIYCRLVLGQSLLFGGQGPGMQQNRDPSNPSLLEQSKYVAHPLQGGGILCTPSDLPKQRLLSLPGITVEQVNELTETMTQNCAAKHQKDALRDLLRIAAENLKQSEDTANNGIWSRAAESESLLNQNTRSIAVPALPEKLVTQSMVAKLHQKEEEPPPGLGQIFKIT